MIKEYKVIDVQPADHPFEFAITCDGEIICYVPNKKNAELLVKSMQKAQEKLTEAAQEILRFIRFEDIRNALKAYNHDERNMIWRIVEKECGL